MKLIKKITLKDVCGVIGSLDNLVKMKNEGPLPLMEVIGMARSAKPAESDKGEYVIFLGTFQATNLRTGEVYQSGKAILAGAAVDLLYGVMIGRPAGSGDVQFGFRYSARHDESAITKYVFVVESMIKPAKTDPLQMLSAAIASGAEIPLLTNLAPSTQADPETGEVKPGVPDPDEYAEKGANAETVASDSDLAKAVEAAPQKSGKKGGAK